MKPKIKFALVTLILFIFIIAAAEEKQETRWKGKTEVKNGVKIIKNPKKPMYGNEVISVEEDLKIGEAEGDDNYMFSQIANFVIDENENIYVADFKETKVKVYDKNGKFLRVFGREGKGPGEIGRIYSIQINTKNELLVHDGRNMKIQYFSLDGEFIRSKDLVKIRPLRLYVDSNENYYVITAVIDPPNSRYELLKCDDDMNIVATVAKIPAPDPTKPFNPFMLIFYFQVLEDGCLLYGYPENYELQIFNPEGRVIKKIIKDYDPVPITEAEKEERQQGIRPGRKIEFPRYHPPFSYFKIDERGRIFVHTWEKPDSGEEHSFDVFDSEGRYIAKIALNFRPAVMKKGKMYTKDEDEDGYQYIKRYKVSWKY